MFFKKRNSQNNIESIPLIKKLVNDGIYEYVKPVLRRYIKEIDFSKLNTTDEIEIFINEFTDSRALNTNRYLYIYLITPEEKRFKKSVVYDKYTEEIRASENELYTFRYNNEMQRLYIGKDNNVLGIDFYKFGYNIYGLAITYDKNKHIYSVTLWTNFMPKFIKLYDIIDFILYKKTASVYAKIEAIKNLLRKNRNEIEILPIQVKLFYHPVYEQILTSYSIQIEEYCLTVNTEFFSQEVREAYYKDPYNDIVKLM